MAFIGSYSIKQRQEIMNNAFAKEFRDEFGEQIDKRIRVIVEPDKLNKQRFLFSDAILFGLGDDKLKEEGEKTLIRVGKIFVEHREIYDRIYIEGHTDNLSINTERFPSNWALSSARATSVIQLFIDKFPLFKKNPRLLTATGYGEYLPIAQNPPDGFTLLFSVSQEFQTELNKNTLPNKLRQEFANHKITLSQNTINSVKKIDKDTWQVDDEQQVYIIRKKEAKLNIYVKGQPLNRRIEIVVEYASETEQKP